MRIGDIPAFVKGVSERMRLRDLYFDATDTAAVKAQSLTELRDKIAQVLERHIRPLLPVTLGDYQLTFIARTENPEADILVTQDSESGVLGVVDRSFNGGRNAL